MQRVEEIELIAHDDVEAPAEENSDSFWTLTVALLTSSIPVSASSMNFNQFILGFMILSLSDNDEMVASSSLILKMLGLIYIAFAFISPSANIIMQQRTELEMQRRFDVDVDSTTNANYDEINCRISAIGKAVFAGSLVGIPLAMTALSLAEKILIYVFQQPPSNSHDAASYLDDYPVASVPGIAMRLTLEAILFGFQKRKQLSGMGLTSLTLSVLIGLGYSYGIFGNEPMRRNGTGLILAIEPYITSVMYALFVRLHVDFKDYDFLSRRNNKYVLAQCKLIFRSGVPAFVNTTVDTAASMSLVALTGITGGKSALFVNSLIHPFTSFSSTLKAGFVKNVALELRERAVRRDASMMLFARRSPFIATLCVMPPTIVYSAVPDLMLMITGQTFNNMPYMRGMAILLGSIQIFDTLRVTLSAQLHSAEGATFPTVVNFLGLASGVTAGAFLGIHTSGGALALTGSYACSLVMTSGVLALRARYKVNDMNIRHELTDTVSIFGVNATPTMFTKLNPAGVAHTNSIELDNLEQNSLSLQYL